MQFLDRSTLTLALLAVLIAVAFHSNFSTIKATLSPKTRVTLMDRDTTVNGRGTERIVFWSCYRQNLYNPFWDILLTIQPNGLIWMGDNIYADLPGTQKETLNYIFKRFIREPTKTILSLTTRSESVFEPAPPTVIEQAYQRVRQHPSYQALLSSPKLHFVLGTWDDHDYGVNDGDKTYPYKETSKKLFLDFIGATTTDPRRRQHGVYTSYNFQIRSLSHSTVKNVLVILLDTRYNKDPWKVGRTGDFLGEDQWSWLNTTLRISQADIHIVVSSIQVLPERRSVTESWGGFPECRMRLLNLVSTEKVRNLVFLSGDVHFAEMSHLSHNASNEAVQFWEFTSSGLTHSTGRLPYGLGFVMNLLVKYIAPAPHTLRSADGVREVYTGRNMGLLDIVWDGDVPLLSFKILNSKAEIVLEKTLRTSTPGDTRWWLTEA